MSVLNLVLPVARSSTWWWRRSALALIASLGLAGCVTTTTTSTSNTGSGGGLTPSAPTPSTGSGASAMAGDIVTESDEPAERKRARNRLTLAVGYFNQGQNTIALDEVKQALVIDPEFGDAYNVRGLVYMRLNDPRLAEESFKRGLALKPRDGSIMHNYGWLMCQQKRYSESLVSFDQALANPTYGERSKTMMAKGLCQERAGRPEEAERTLAQSYELDAGNPVTGYNLSRLLFERGELARAQFYIRRLNNSEFANAESFWLGIRVERRIGDSEAMKQLADQLRKRFPQSPEYRSYEKGDFQ